jgi:hypothetical protein
VNEWAFFSYIMARASYISWDENDVRFILDQYDLLHFNGASTLKQQSVGMHAFPFGHNIMILSQSVGYF